MSELATQLAAALPENATLKPEWLGQLRRHGTEQFRLNGLPRRKDEAWKYTGLGTLGQGDIQLVDDGQATKATPEDTPPVMAEAFAPAGLQVNLLDGRLVSTRGELPVGVSVLALPAALKDEAAGLRPMLEALPAEGSALAFAAINTATLERGLVIHVSAGVDAGRVLINYASVAGALPELYNSRICLLLEAGGRLELLEQFESGANNSSPNDRNVGNVVLQADLATAARLQHIRLQQEPAGAALITRTEVIQQADSRYDYFGFDLGGGLVRHDLHSALLGNGAQATLNGAYLVDGQRHIDNHARIDHWAVDGISKQFFRGVVGGSGKAVFNTAVVVHPGANGTDALQSNANILLSTRAEIDTKPELEIYADEVLASHGATVGQLDEQAVFYLRTRGLPEDQARQLLTAAFCRSVSDKLTDTDLAETILERMLAVLPKA